MISRTNARPSSASRPSLELQVPSLLLAKTYLDENKLRRPGVSVETHCKIAGAVARELVARKPEWLRNELFPDGCELFAAVHDIGKICPDFQKRIRASLEPEVGCESLGLDHAAVSAIALRESSEAASWMASVHHGGLREMPSVEDAFAPLYGGAPYQEARERLVAELKACFARDWPSLKGEDAKFALAGLVCVADWIASGEIFDGLENGWEREIAGAVDKAGFTAPAVKHGLAFKDVFGEEPRAIQSEFASAVSEGPGVYVLEAPMGLGKTEAALYAAYKAMERGNATGVYFALPTQTTSNKMHERFEAFLDKAFPGGEARLLHGSAWLRESQLGAEGEPGRSWFASAKRGLLAPFAVGTLDQALLAVLNVRHSFVRAYGLAGKVVVIDEAHSYDAYTGTALLELASLLRRLHCSVLILSATLTAEKRDALLLAGAPNSGNEPKTTETAYPLISARPRDSSRIRTAPSQFVETSSTRLEVLEGETEAVDEKAFGEALARASEGQQVIWIENTVDEAQRALRVLSARLGDAGECGLLHSRFALSDRAFNEARWTSLLGKGEGKERSRRGRILVGTQVLEQSLDIDADFMVTRLCPVDMLIQRSGRLWRHRSLDPFRPSSASRELWLLAPDFRSVLDKERAFGVSGHVYEPYLLYRAQESLRKLEALRSPEGIRPLMEEAYAERSDEPEALRRMLAELHARKERMALKALSKMSKASWALPDDDASTRFQDEILDSTQTILLSSTEIDKGSVRIVFADGCVLDLKQGHDERGARRLAAMAIERNSVKAPLKCGVPIASLEALERLRLRSAVHVRPGARDAGLAIALLERDGTLDFVDGHKLDSSRKLTYSRLLGLVNN